MEKYYKTVINLAKSLGLILLTYLIMLIFVNTAFIMLAVGINTPSMFKLCPHATFLATIATIIGIIIYLSSEKETD